MNIKEIFTISVQVEDVHEDIPATDLPTNKIAQEALRGSHSSSTRDLRETTPTSIIIEAAFCWKRMRIGTLSSPET